MDLAFQLALLLSTLLCTLVAGLVLWFAIIVMPGIARLDDRAYLRAFQVIDGVIQQNQPVFMIVWVGSIPALLATVGLGFFQADTLSLTLLIATAIIYFAGVQLPTFLVNIPMNNRLQQIDITAIDAAQATAARTDFERRWAAWNTFRSVVAIIVSVLLMITLLWATPFA